MFDVADDLFSKDPPTQKEAVAWLALAQQADSQELLLKATSAASAMAREFPDSMAILRAACRVINNAPYSMCVETILKITLQFLERRIDFQDREGQFHLFTAIIRHLFVFGEASDHDRFLALTIDRGMHLFATGQTTRILRRVFFHTGRDGGKKLLDVMANIDRAESDSQYSRLRKHIEGQNPEE
jgi:hypothetical protein